MHPDDTVLEYAGAFRLVRKIAQGGMATVYEAHHLGPAGFSKRIALKVIHPHYAKEKTWLQLFIDEAKLSANLVHGNIVQIYQLGEVDGQYYMSMEFIQGPTLRMVIERHRELGQPIPHVIAAYIASRVCRALDFAHNFVGPDGRRLDIVHRDVSPNNVMATWDGHIKLADFGIAKARTSVDPMDSSPMLMMGKKHYMSPEQLLALQVDGSSDVFAMGVVLYELLTLEPLFYEDATELLIDEVTWRPLPDVHETVPDCPPAIADILEQALERDSARRPTAAAMGHALDRWCEQQSVVATPDRLSEHLALIFPASYQPASVAEGEKTRFSNFKRGLRRAGDDDDSWLRRVWRRVRG
ncbi:MAG TPA: serine/threonine-protein kinase [Gemmatimonadaceae bacterium]|nr:serine/threonine-protein kinase [Gemmatimonadaceae bacterium]